MKFRPRKSETSSGAAEIERVSHFQNISTELNFFSLVLNRLIDIKKIFFN